MLQCLKPQKYTGSLLKSLLVDYYNQQTQQYTTANETCKLNDFERFKATYYLSKISFSAATSQNSFFFRVEKPITSSRPQQTQLHETRP